MKNLSPLLFVFFFLHFHITTGTGTGNGTVTSTHRYNPVENILLNCGAREDSKASDTGRGWIGDKGKFGPIEEPGSHKSVVYNASQKAKVAMDDVPYMTSRMSYSPFTYTFPVTPGPKFVRFYFYPISFPGFDRSKGFFTVKANSFTLFKNFSASLLVDYYGTGYNFQEFCVSVGENQMLNLTFIPTPSDSGGSFALISGIEIVSMPNNLYYPKEGEGLPHVGKNSKFFIENRAIQIWYRLNVGGGLIPQTQDTGMFREWSPGKDYLWSDSLNPTVPGMKLKYTKIKDYTAPDDIYRSASAAGYNFTENLLSNLTWKLPVDEGFSYLVRLHFCELQPQITKVGERQFIVYIDNHTAEERADIIEWTGGNSIPVYRDYVVTIESNRDLFVALHPVNVGYVNSILNGMEVFKLSNISDGSLASPNPDPVVTSPPPGQQQQQQPALTTKKSTKKTVFIAIGAGSGFLVLLSLACCMVLWKLRKSKRYGSYYPLSRCWCWPDDPYRGKSSRTKASSLPEELCRHFSLPEIKTATNSFHKELVIGLGGFGNVYIGHIDGGTTTVAIKRLNPESRQGAREFRTEIELLSQLRHVHLVSLIGYCDDEGEMILVYDYMTNGTLRDHLYDSENNPIPWKNRLEICIGAARGLNYLHTGVKNTIIHRDVKTTNILLDDNWVAKVSDFGLSKMGLNDKAVSTMVKGTIGYLDPEYAKRQQLTDKSDVYSFGVVLFEILCARKALNPKLEQDQWNLANWAKKCIETGTISEIIDPYLIGKIAPECFKVFVEIAESCVRDHGIDRPTMNDVMEKLSFALKLQEDAAAEKERNNPGGEHKYKEVLSFHSPATTGGPQGYDHTLSGHIESDSEFGLTGTSLNSGLTSVDFSKDLTDTTVSKV